MKKRIIIPLILAALVVACLYLASPKTDDVKASPNTISVDTAIEYLEKSIYSHEYYLNNIDKDKNVITGFKTREFMIEHHQGCIDRYTKIIELLESMR